VARLLHSPISKKRRCRIVEGNKAAVQPSPIRCLVFEWGALVRRHVVPIRKAIRFHKRDFFRFGERSGRAHCQDASAGVAPKHRTDRATRGGDHSRVDSSRPQNDCSDTRALRDRTLRRGSRSPKQHECCLCAVLAFGLFVSWHRPLNAPNLLLPRVSRPAPPGS
jgi:hypothetical protein